MYPAGELRPVAVVVAEVEAVVVAVVITEVAAVPATEAEAGDDKRI